VIGIGIEASTSALLPPACDEFLFYERLEGVEPATPKRSSRSAPARRGRRAAGTTKDADAEPEAEQLAADEPARPREADLGVLVTQTLSGLERSTGGPVLASMLKRTILRKDPTFSETTYGFRGFMELLRSLAERGVIEVDEGTDPAVGFPAQAAERDAAFELLRKVVAKLAGTKSGPPHLSGLKNQLRKSDPDFSEKRFGYGGFLQFAKATAQRGGIELDWDDAADDYVVRPVTPKG
jgi:hypothetical protein